MLISQATEKTFLLNASLQTTADKKITISHYKIYFNFIELMAYVCFRYYEVGRWLFNSAHVINSKSKSVNYATPHVSYITKYLSLMNINGLFKNDFQY